MTDLRVLLAFAALLALALFYIERGVPGAFAPLCAVGTAALALSAFGCFGLLRLGGWVVYLAALAAAGWLVFRRFVQKKPVARPGLPFWFFAAGGLCVMLLLWAKQPMFTEWDEFSFWGTAGKLMKLNDTLYTTAPIGWTWPVTNLPVLPAFSYFFQFFGPGFAEWQTYAAYDVLMLAAMATVLAPFGRRAPAETSEMGFMPPARRAAMARAARTAPAWPAALPVMLVCLLAPFVFRHYGQITTVSPAWLSSYADTPMGLTFAAALCCWFGGDKTKLGTMAPVGIALAVLTLTKDVGVALALVAAVLILVDMLFVPGRTPFKKRLGPAFSRFGIAVGSVVAAFGGWSLYMKAAMAVDRLESAGGKLDAGLLEFPGLYLRDLLASPKSDFFIEINTGMVRIFFTSKISMLGSGAMLAAAALALVALAALLSGSKLHRRRCLVFGIFSTLGFACYYLLIIMTYLYLMRTDQALAFTDYNRYVIPYTIGWLLCAVLLLGQSAAEAGKKAWRPLAARAALLLFGAALFARVAMLIPPHLTILGVNPAEYNERRLFVRETAALTGRLEPDDRVFYLNSGDTGAGWFMLSYQMLPWQLDYSIGGGDLYWRDTVDGERIEWPATADELAHELIDSGCTVLYIANADDAFRETYGGLFSDGMNAYFKDGIDLYAVVPDPGGKTAHLEPLPKIVPHPSTNEAARAN